MVRVSLDPVEEFIERVFAFWLNLETAGSGKMSVSLSNWHLYVYHSDLPVFTCNPAFSQKRLSVTHLK